MLIITNLAAQKSVYWCWKNILAGSLRCKTDTFTRVKSTFRIAAAEMNRLTVLSSGFFIYFGSIIRENGRIDVGLLNCMAKNSSNLLGWYGRFPTTIMCSSHRGLGYRVVRHSTPCS